MRRRRRRNLGLILCTLLPLLLCCLLLLSLHLVFVLQHDFCLKTFTDFVSQISFQGCLSLIHLLLLYGLLTAKLLPSTATFTFKDLEYAIPTPCDRIIRAMTGHRPQCVMVCHWMSDEGTKPVVKLCWWSSWPEDFIVCYNLFLRMSDQKIFYRRESTPSIYHRRWRVNPGREGGG